jgi:hypothetical protein
VPSFVFSLTGKEKFRVYYQIKITYSDQVAKKEIWISPKSKVQVSIKQTSFKEDGIHNAAVPSI